MHPVTDPISTIPSVFVVDPATGACLLKDATQSSAVSECVRQHASRGAATAAVDTETSSSGLSAAERADALRERLQQRNMQRQEEAEAEQHKGEVERRRAMKDLAKIKREREQAEARKAAQEIKRDRQEARRRKEEARRKIAEVGLLGIACRGGAFPVLITRCAG